MGKEEGAPVNCVSYKRALKLTIWYHDVNAGLATNDNSILVSIDVRVNKDVSHILTKNILSRGSIMLQRG